MVLLQVGLVSASFEAITRYIKGVGVVQATRYVLGTLSRWYIWSTSLMLGVSLLHLKTIT